MKAVMNILHCKLWVNSYNKGRGLTSWDVYSYVNKETYGKVNPVMTPFQDVKRALK